MPNRFVVFTGVPGSGKTRLARQVSPILNLPVIDKDDILEHLFELKGVGDAEWRHKLSRESDAILESEAKASSGALLVSFWHQFGMSQESGTPIHWLAELSGHVVNVYCACEPEIAAQRFAQRKRHAGHLDGHRSYPEILASIRALASLGAPGITPLVEVDTSTQPNLEAVVQQIIATFDRFD